MASATKLPSYPHKFKKATKKIIEENKVRFKYHSILETLDKSKIKNILLPVFIMNWILGMGVIEYPLGRPWPLTSLVYTTSSIIVFSLLVVVSYFNVYLKHSDFVYCSISRIILFYSNIVVSISFVLLGWYHREGTYYCLRKLIVADNLLDLIGIKKSARKTMRALMEKIVVLVFVLIVMLTLNLMTAIMLDESAWKKVARIVVSYYPILTTFVTDFTFMYCIRKVSVSCKFVTLNAFLRGLITTGEEPGETIVAKKPMIAKNDNQAISGVTIKWARKIHAILLKICEEAEKTYRLQMLISIVVALVTITGNLYEIYSLISNFRPQFYRPLVESVIWIIYHMIKIGSISLICSGCRSNAVTTGDVINKLYDDPMINDEAQEEIRNFNMQLVEKPLSLSAFGFVNFDNTLIQMSIGVITTYLVILIDTT